MKSNATKRFNSKFHYYVENIVKLNRFNNKKTCLLIIRIMQEDSVKHCLKLFELTQKLNYLYFERKIGKKLNFSWILFNCIARKSLVKYAIGPNFSLV